MDAICETRHYISSSLPPLPPPTAAVALNLSSLIQTHQDPYVAGKVTPACVGVSVEDTFGNER